MNYTFASNLLVAQGNPAALNISLSSNDLSVVIDALSAYVGLAFNPTTITTGTSALQAITIQGNSLRIAEAYHNQTFALLKADRTATTFIYLSAGGAIAPLSATNNVSYPETRRLSVLGYI